MPFTRNFNIECNQGLRPHQRECWAQIRDYYSKQQTKLAVSVVLPVGAGKSGLIAIVPFALSANRVLVIAPGTKIRDQLAQYMKPSNPNNFYEKCGVISSSEGLPETVVVAAGIVNHDDIANADIVVSNIHQIAGDENKWLDRLERNFFDVILVDEGHHNPAASWRQVFARFPESKIVNFSATPARADGQLMEGEVIYSFPIVSAIQAGYVKRLSAKMLRPTELTYIDHNSGDERTIDTSEVIRLGQEDSKFRRGIVQSEQSLASIVDCAIKELNKLRQDTQEQRLKIIASAMNIDHCIQIVAAFRSRGLRAAHVHSKEGQDANQRILQDLENHALDVIVQAKMLSEGFDHKFLSVAMVASIFSNLSPFVQFIGRIMRVIVEKAPDNPLNHGIVIFHAGGNIAGRWEDFRNFSEADQEFFNEFLPEADDIVFEPDGTATRELGRGYGQLPINVISETDVRAAIMNPIGDPKIQAILQQLADQGVTPEEAAEGIRRIQPSRQDKRIARRNELSDRIKNEAGRIISSCGISHKGKTLDPSYQCDNFVWVVQELNRRINSSISQISNNRENFTLEQLNQAHSVLDDVASALQSELRNG